MTPDQRVGWREVVHENTPFWGTTHPLSIHIMRSASIYDTNGRPLVEGQDEQPNPANVPNELTVVNFSDARKGMRANRSAYAATTRHLDTALSLLSYIRGTVYPYDEPFDEHRMAEAIQTSFMIGRYLVLKSDSPRRNGEVVPEIGALAKIAGGLSKVPTAAIGKNRLREYLGGTPQPVELHTPEQFLDAVFTDELAFGNDNDDGLVCPAPASVMLRSIHPLYCPVPVSEETKDLLGLSEEGIRRAGRFGQGNSIAAVESLFLQAAQLGVIERTEQKIAKLGVSRSTPLRALFVEQANTELEGIAKIFLRGTNEAQRIMNNALLRDPAPDMTLEDIDLA